MQTFGFSAFLKLICLNPRPQKTEVRKRLAPSSNGGYDFHKSMRQRARSYLIGGEPMSAVIASTSVIARHPERNSAIVALEHLEEWRLGTPGEIVEVDPVVYESPRHAFRVRFDPVFGLRVGRRVTAFDLWNTQRPRLSTGSTFAALSLIAETYESLRDGPDRVAVLSLREPVTPYILTSVGEHAVVAESLVEHIEDLIHEGPAPTLPTPDHRPTTS